MEVSALTTRPAHPIPGLPGRSPLLRLQSDERLIALVRRGSHGAFEEVVRRYQARLLSFCRHMLSSREDAEDVLQEVFAAAFNAILADERPINVRPWLYRIARNRSLNHLRRAQAIGVDSMDVHLAEHGTTTADKVDSREAFRELIADVGDLPETQRTALLLREIDALSYEQIAEAMETTIPSVKSLLVRARVSLAEAAEARRLSCEEVRFELGEVAEGLRRRTSPPVRRHLRTCERCAIFRTELRSSTKALALMLPVGPLLLMKKLLLAHVGLSFGAGGAGGTASGGVAIGAAAGTAAVGTGATGGLVSAGIGAVVTKTAMGLAAAALVTASAVEIEHRAPHHAQPQVHAVAQAPAVQAIPQAIARGVPAPAKPEREKKPPPDAATVKDKPTAAEEPASEPATTTVATTVPTTEDPGRTQLDTSTTSLPVALPQTTATVAPTTATAVAAPSADAVPTATVPGTTVPAPPVATPPVPPVPPVVTTPPPPPPPPAEPGTTDPVPTPGGDVPEQPEAPPAATPSP